MTPIIVSGIGFLATFLTMSIKLLVSNNTLGNKFDLGFTNLSSKIDHNTKITKGYQDKKTYFEELDQIYSDVMRKCENKDICLTHISTNRYEELKKMIQMFCEIGVEKLQPNVISSKMSTFIAESDKAMNDLVCPEFTEYFSHSMRGKIRQFSIDLCSIINPNAPKYRFNNIKDKFRNKSRDHIEDILIEMIISYQLFRKETINAIEKA